MSNPRTIPPFSESTTAPSIPKIGFAPNIERFQLDHVATVENTKKISEQGDAGKSPLFFLPSMFLLIS